MKKAMILQWLVDHEGKTVIAKTKTIDAPMKEEDNLPFFYEQIGCKYIDVVQFKDFDVFVDDEGLLESGNVVCEYTQGEFTVPLAGNLVFTNGIDSIGRTIWFESNSPDDIVTMAMISRMIEKAELVGLTQEEKKEIF